MVILPAFTFAHFGTTPQGSPFLPWGSAVPVRLPAMLAADIRASWFKGPLPAFLLFPWQNTNDAFLETSNNKTILELKCCQCLVHITGEDRDVGEPPTPGTQRLIRHTLCSLPSFLKKRNLKCTIYNSIYMTFWKNQNNRDRSRWLLGAGNWKKKKNCTSKRILLKYHH